MCPGTVVIPFEYFCGGRSLKEFIKDLFKIPDKVEQAMDAAMVDLSDNVRQSFRRLKPFGAWVGGWRSASEFLSPKVSQRFVFPYLTKMINICIEEGVVPLLHFDSDWSRDLPLMKQLFPKGKCVLAIDGATDIFKAKEVLGDQCVFSAMYLLDCYRSANPKKFPHTVNDWSAKSGRGALSWGRAVIFPLTPRLITSRR